MRRQKQVRVGDRVRDSVRNRVRVRIAVTTNLPHPNLYP